MWDWNCFLLGGGCLKGVKKGGGELIFVFSPPKGLKEEKNRGGALNYYQAVTYYLLLPRTQPSTNY